MLIPTNYENLTKNLMVLGASVIGLLRKKKYSIEEMYQIMKEEKAVNLHQFYNILSFLWITEVIDSDNFYIFLKK